MWSMRVPPFNRKPNPNDPDYCQNLTVSSMAHVKEERKRIYIAPLLKYLTLKALRYGSHSVTCKLHRTCLYLVSIHQMAHCVTFLPSFVKIGAQSCKQINRVET